MMISSHNVLSLKEFEIRIHYVQFMRLAVSKITLVKRHIIKQFLIVEIR